MSSSGRVVNKVRSAPRCARNISRGATPPGAVSWNWAVVYATTASTNVCLVGEVVVQRRVIDAGVLRDLSQTQALEAHRGNALECRLHQCCAPGLASGSVSTNHLVDASARSALTGPPVVVIGPAPGLTGGRA